MYVIVKRSAVSSRPLQLLSLKDSRKTSGLSARDEHPRYALVSRGSANVVVSLKQPSSSP